MALDVTGREIAETCENCEGLYDDSDGPEYGPPSPRCNRKPHMENLKGFPFKTPQRCFELHWSHLIDWDEEAKKMHKEEQAFLSAHGVAVLDAESKRDQPPMPSPLGEG